MLEERIKAVHPAEIEYVFVEKLKLPFCDGCLQCVMVGEHECPEYDTIRVVAKKMDEADGIILGSPVHTFAITGLMKNFVEFFMYKRNRPSFFGKKALGIAVASGGGHKNVLDVLEHTSTAWGCDVVAQLGVSSTQLKKEGYLQALDEEVEDMAQKFVRAIERHELDPPKLRHMINFRAMQRMAYSATETVNHSYWKERGWFNKEYYTDVPLNPFARLMAGYIARKMRQSTKKGNARPLRVS
jgi:multimeric flavodoxin WrbA